MMNKLLALLGLSALAGGTDPASQAAEAVVPTVTHPGRGRSWRYEWLKRTAYNEHHSVPLDRMRKQHATALRDPELASGADAMMNDYLADARTLRNVRKARRRALRGAL